MPDMAVATLDLRKNGSIMTAEFFHLAIIPYGERSPRSLAAGFVPFLALVIISGPVHIVIGL
jgi:hypothetical protein